MKKFALSVLAIATVMFVFTSCKKDVEKQIIGKWKVTSIQVTGLDQMVEQLSKTMGIPDDQVAAYVEQMKKEMNDNYKSSMENQNIEFTEDHKVISSDNKDQAEDWTFDKENNKILIKSGDNNVEFIVKEINDSKMKAQMIGGDKTAQITIDMDMERVKE